MWMRCGVFIILVLFGGLLAGTVWAETEPSQKEKAAPIRYKRHDVGGERQIAPKKEKSGFSDRESRLPSDDRRRTVSRPRRNGKSSTAKKRTPKNEVLVEFEKKRQYSWERRKNARLLAAMSKADQESARQKLMATLGAPLASLGGRVFWFKAGAEPGIVGAAEIDVNIVRYRVRAGLSTLLGIRSMAGPDDLVLLESLNVGLQWPSRFSPYGLVKGGLGTLLSNDGKSTEADLIGAVSIEAGLDAWVSPWLVVTPSIGYMGIVKSWQYRNTFTAKIAIGF